MSEVVVTEVDREAASQILAGECTCQPGDYECSVCAKLPGLISYAIAKARQEGRDEKKLPVKRTKAIAPPPPSAETWNAYEQAYESAYHVKPVRNVRTNSQCCKLVQCLGAEEAPKVAAWYLGHRNFRYVNAGHSISMLVMDCEKLRTEWATGMRLHQRDAVEIDRTSADTAMWNRVEQRVQARREG